MKHSVIVFAKAPVPGKAKTRLAAGIGAARAEEFATAFIADVCESVARLNVRSVLAFAGDEDHPAFDRARQLGFAFREQPAGDLGARLDGVIRQECELAEDVIAIGSDSPTIRGLHFEEGWEALRKSEIAIGPSFDGGYYLLGVRADWFVKCPSLHPIFDGIAWSSRHVLDQTLRRCADLRALCELIRFCYDVDTPEDLELLQTHLLGHLRPSGLDVAQNTAILLSNTLTD